MVYYIHPYLRLIFPRQSVREVAATAGVLNQICDAKPSLIFSNAPVPAEAVYLLRRYTSVVSADKTGIRSEVLSERVVLGAKSSNQLLAAFMTETVNCCSFSCLLMMSHHFWHYCNCRRERTG